MSGECLEVEEAINYIIDESLPDVDQMNTLLHTIQSMNKMGLKDTDKYKYLIKAYVSIQRLRSTYTL